jgi:hypothetical protein
VEDERNKNTGGNKSVALAYACYFHVAEAL